MRWRGGGVLFYFLGFAGSKQCIPHHMEDTRKEQSTDEDKGSSHPVVKSEWVLEVKDGQDEAEELTKRDDECDDERGTLCSQDENTADAHIRGGQRSK